MGRRGEGNYLVGLRSCSCFEIEGSDLNDYPKENENVSRWMNAKEEALLYTHIISTMQPKLQEITYNYKQLCKYATRIVKYHSSSVAI